MFKRKLIKQTRAGCGNTNKEEKRENIFIYNYSSCNRKKLIQYIKEN